MPIQIAFDVPVNSVVVNRFIYIKLLLYFW